MDDEIDLIGENDCISTQALKANSKQKFSLKSKEKSYVFRLPVEKFTTIVTDFVNKLQEEKILILKNVYLFKYLDKRTINEIANISTIKKYNKRHVLIKENTQPEYIYVIVEGEVVCGKNNHLSAKLTQNCVFGELWLFTQINSYYSYIVGATAKILRVKISSFINLLDSKPIKAIIGSIFNAAIKSSKLLSKYFYEGNMQKLFEVFTLKYYYKDLLVSKKQKKFFIQLGGRIVQKTTIKNKIENQESNRWFLEETLNLQGMLYGEELLAQNNQTTQFVIATDEAVVFEANWIDILKRTKSFNNKNFSMYTIISLFRNHVLFSRLDELKLFQLAENFKFTKYKTGEKILKNGPSSDKFYIIVSGKVGMEINNVEVKWLSDGHSFGDIISKPTSFSQKATYFAKTNVECFYLEVECYKEIFNVEKFEISPTLNLKDETLSLDKLYYVKDLGQGSFGKVYLVHDSKDFYAMKTAEIQKLKENKESAHIFLNEKTIMYSINYPFIVKLINTYKTKDFIFFLMEFVNGVTLRYYLNLKTKNDFRNIDEFTFFGAILGTILNYLQKNRIIHRDLKPDNLMIDQDGYLKAIDFGVAKDLAGKDSTHTVVGTIHYMAPEVISGKNYSFGVDFWSVGIILFEVFYGKQPFGFGNKDPQSVYLEILGKQLILPSDPKNESVNQLIKGLLSKNPSKRIKHFTKYKSMNLFDNFNFDSLIKREIKSPISRIPTIKDKPTLLGNTLIPFYQFMQSNIFFSSNDLSDFLNRNNPENEFLSEF